MRGGVGYIPAERLFSKTETGWCEKLSYLVTNIYLPFSRIWFPYVSHFQNTKEDNIRVGEFEWNKIAILVFGSLVKTGNRIWRDPSSNTKRGFQRGKF